MAKQSPIHSHVHQGFVTMDTQQKSSLPRASSLENFRKHMDATLSSRKSTKSTDSNFGGSLRKAKSDSDVAMQTLKKKVEVLYILYMLHASIINNLLCFL